MNTLVPQAWLTALIEPHHPKGKGGRPPMSLERMLRVYFMKQWFNLSDLHAEDTLCDIEPLRRLAASSWPPTWALGRGSTPISTNCSRARDGARCRHSDRLTF
jgi:hypothetical protein